MYRYLIILSYGQLLQNSSKSLSRDFLRGKQDLDISNIKIRDVVSVSHYGDANFTTIKEAIAFAPTNSRVQDGYFIIYIKRGYYEEYVTISKHKKGIMLLGDGINQTVISGSRNVIDGWTTFNSATFGKLKSISHLWE